MMTTFLLQFFGLSMTCSLLILCLWGFTAISKRKFSARCRYILWCLLIFRLCLPLNPTFLPALYEVTILAETTVQTIRKPAENLPDDNTEPVSAETMYTAPSRKDTEIPEAEGDTPEASAAEKDQIAVLCYNIRRFMPYLFPIWITTAAVLFGFRMIAYGCTIRRLTRTRHLPTEIQLTLCRRMGRRLGIEEQKIPPLYSTSEVHSPMLCGFVRPAILMPDISVTDSQLTGILAHELTHYRRRDLWVRLACVLAVSLHWFNPFVWFAAERCGREMELSCDESVLNGMEPAVRVSYGRVVLDIIKLCTTRVPALTTHFQPGQTAVRERFENILDDSSKRRGYSLILLMAMLCTAAGCLVAFRKVEMDIPIHVDEGFYLTAEPAESDTSVRTDITSLEVYHSFADARTVCTAVLCDSPDMSVLRDGMFPLSKNTEANPDTLYSRYQISYMSEYTEIFAAAGPLLTGKDPAYAYVYCRDMNGQWHEAALPAPVNTHCKGVVLRGITRENKNGWLLGVLADDGSISFYRSQDGLTWQGGTAALRPSDNAWLVQYSRHSGVGGETLCLVFDAPGWTKEQIWLSFDWGETFTHYDIPVTEALPGEYSSLQYLGKTGTADGEYALYFLANGKKGNHHIQFIAVPGNAYGTTSIYTYTASPHVRNMISEYRYTSRSDNGGIFWNP